MIIIITTIIIIITVIIIIRIIRIRIIIIINNNNNNNNIYVTLCSVGKTAECYCMLLYVAVIHCTPVLSRMVPEARSIGGQPQQCINFPLGHNGAAGGVGEKYDGR